MISKITRVGDAQGLILDQDVLNHLGVKEGDQVELSIRGKLVIISSPDSSVSDEQLAELTDEFDQQYNGMMKRLAE